MPCHGFVLLESRFTKGQTCRHIASRPANVSGGRNSLISKRVILFVLTNVSADDLPVFLGVLIAISVVHNASIVARVATNSVDPAAAGVVAEYGAV
jgi:hypothetical protein